MCSQVIGGNPAWATKLLVDQGQAVTDVGDLEVEAFQLYEDLGGGTTAYTTTTYA